MYWVERDVYFVRHFIQRVRTVARLGFGECMQHVRQSVRSAGIVMAPGLVQRTNNKSARLYHQKPYLGKITHFLSIYGQTLFVAGYRFGWSKIAVGGVRIHHISDSTHMTTPRYPHVKVLAEFGGIKNDIDKVA